MAIPQVCKTVLIKSHRIWKHFIPNFYYPYKFDGGYIYLNIKESGMMLRRALGCYELTKQEAFKKFVRPGSTFIDVGCNKGDFALLGSRLVGPQGRVLAFEPHPDNCQWVRKSIAKNAYQNVELFEMALSDVNGTAELYIGEKSGFHTLVPGQPFRSKGFIQVKTRRLDDFLDEIGFTGSIGAIKIDVEGADMQVLRGAQKTISGNPGIIIFLDVHRYLGVNPTEVCNYLKNLGLNLFTEDPPFNVPVRDYNSLDALIATYSSKLEEKATSRSS